KYAAARFSAKPRAPDPSGSTTPAAQRPDLVWPVLENRWRRPQMEWYASAPLELLTELRLLIFTLLVQSAIRSRGDVILILLTVGIAVAIQPGICSTTRKLHPRPMPPTHPYRALTPPGAARSFVQPEPSVR